MNKYKRLTRRIGDYITTNCIESCPYYDKCDGEDCQCDKAVYDRLAELEDKIENGTLIELPCKVGTKVFYIQMDYDDDGVLYHYVEEVEFGLWCMSYWGLWIFLTKAEAEAKLKEVESGKVL